MVLEARYWYCKKCSAIFKSAKGAGIDGTRCPLCGSTILHSARDFMADLLKLLSAEIEVAEATAREIEECIRGVDELFLKLLRARKAGVMVHRELDEKLLVVYATLDEIVMRSREQLSLLREELSRKLSELERKLFTQGRAKLTEFFPKEGAARRMLSGLMERIENVRSSVERMKKDVEEVVKVAELVTFLNEGEVILDTLYDGGVTIVITDARVCEVVNGDRARVCVSLSRISDVTKQLIGGKAIIRTLDGGKVKLSVKFSEELRAKVLGVAFSNRRDMVATGEVAGLKEVVAPDVTALLAEVVELKETVVRLLGRVSRSLLH